MAFHRPICRMARRRLQVLLGAMGVVAAAAGADGVLRGASGVRAAGRVSADVDSEFRFFAAWYAAFGVLLLDAARGREGTERTVRIASGGLLAGAIGRVLSIRRFGRPSVLYRILMAIEIVLPVLVLAWRDRALGEPRTRLGGR